MQATHVGMCIPQAVFNAFVTTLGSTLTTLGVSGPDVAAVAGVLNSLGPQIVNGGGSSSCNASTPVPVGPPPPGTCGAQCGPTCYFNMTTVPKGNGSPQLTAGFPLNFIINGVPAPACQLVAGCTYTFQSFASCIHPFYFMDNLVGASTGTELTDPGLSAADITQVCNGGNPITWSVTSATVTALAGKQYYYGCRVHGNMGWQVNTVNSLGSTTTTGTTTGTTTTGPIATVAPVTAVSFVVALLAMALLQI